MTLTPKITRTHTHTKSVQRPLKSYCVPNHVKQNLILLQILQENMAGDETNNFSHLVKK